MRHHFVAVFMAAASAMTGASAGVSIRADLMSCEETYGGGWAPCGDEQSSKFCYSPLLGQSCCSIDSGYCDAGTYCAPVAGHCCIDGEDMVTCAANAGFQLPGNSDGDRRVVGPQFISSSLFPTNLSSGGRTNSVDVVLKEPIVQVSAAGKGGVALSWMACVAGLGLLVV